MAGPAVTTLPSGSEQCETSNHGAPNDHLYGRFGETLLWCINYRLKRRNSIAPQCRRLRVWSLSSCWAYCLALEGVILKDYYWMYMFCDYLLIFSPSVVRGLRADPMCVFNTIACFRCHTPMRFNKKTHKKHKTSHSQNSHWHACFKKSCKNKI